MKIVTSQSRKKIDGWVVAPRISPVYRNFEQNTSLDGDL